MSALSPHGLSCTPPGDERPLTKGMTETSQRHKLSSLKDVHFGDCHCSEDIFIPAEITRGAPFSSMSICFDMHTRPSRSHVLPRARSCAGCQSHPWLNNRQQLGEKPVLNLSQRSTVLADTPPHEQKAENTPPGLPQILAPEFSHQGTEPGTVFPKEVSQPR